MVVPHRFCGPPVSGNGGWSAGAVAAHLPRDPDARSEAWPTIEVTLRQPPPLDTPLLVTDEDGVLTVTRDGDPAAILVARAVGHTLTPTEPVDPEAAAAAEAGFPGFVEHPFGSCFSCGPDRAVGDGLRIFPGPVAPDRVAAVWTPDPGLAEESAAHEGTHPDEAPRTSLPVAWAALDCAGGWAEDLLGRPMVLGRITARIDDLPVVGERHVVVGEHRGSEGRKTFTAATLYDSDGREVATAEHVWFAIDPADYS